MKRLIGALKAKLSRLEQIAVPDQRGRTLSVDDVPLPDIYAEKKVDPAPEFGIVHPPGTDDSDGFNPYDTAILHKRK